MKGTHSALFILAAIGGLSGCQTVPTTSQSSSIWPIQNLQWIGETRIPNNTHFNHTWVGGLSGIDYNPKTKQWVVISDDRVEHGPARAYLGTMSITATQISPFKINQMITFYQPDDHPYISAKQFDHHGTVPDFESIRFNPNSPTLRYTSEGDRKLWLNPFIRDASVLDGQFRDSVAVPKQIKLQNKQPEYGFYDNLALEGSSFTPSGEYYFAAMEAPVKQDGNVPNGKHGTNARLTKYDASGHIVAEYVYPVDAWPANPGKGKHADNGVSEILAIDNNHLLFLERAGIQDAKGSYHNFIRIYEVSTQGATNVMNQDSLASTSFKPMKKHLLLNLNTLNLKQLDNIEGISFGPTLEDGTKTLVLISDNNFNRHEITQLLAFSIH